jgi:pyridoxal biosynthesis lyase PdxS
LFGTTACSREAFGQVRKMTRNIAEDGLRIDEDVPNSARKWRFVAVLSSLVRRQAELPLAERACAGLAIYGDRRGIVRYGDAGTYLRNPTHRSC